MIENAGKLSVRRMDESLTEYGMAYDAGSHEMHLAMSGPVPESGGVTIFKVTELGQGLLQIEGNWGNVPMSLKLKAIDRNGFTLVSRGFHWISETSFIR